MKKYLNGKEVEMTSQEIVELEDLRKICAVHNATLENEVINKIANQVSGNQKLLDLGLTQEEATALTGYKPPEEEADTIVL